MPLAESAKPTTTSSDYTASLKAIIEECCDDAYCEDVQSVDDIVAEIQRLNATHFAAKQSSPRELQLTEKQKTKIFEALGQASMCWEPTPTGVFDAVGCKKIGDELISVLEASDAKN